MPCMFDQRRSRRQGKYDGPAAALDGFRKHFDLMTPGKRIVGIEIRIADVIAFDEIHAPGGVQFQQRIVVSLPLRRIAHAVHIRIPAADGTGVGDLVGGHGGSFDRCVEMGGDPRNSPHDVDTEFQSQAVDIFSQRTKAFSVSGRWETFRVREKTGIFVHFQLRKGNVLETIPLRTGFVCVPFNIDDHILPSVFFQMFCHIFSVCSYLGFIDGSVVIIVTVPAHRRMFGKSIFVHQAILLMIKCIFRVDI